ncbi:MAG: AbiV family abortive infection protein [Candidatus Electrothrix sp. AR3]|nr:AbiV family abortive infection protein [Candidatus Electrothrix sp. AR3]
MTINHNTIGLETVEKAVENGSPLFGMDTGSDDFNRACDHILLLIEDAFSCHTRESFGSSVFLAITAIEEIAKAEVGIYRRSEQKDELKRHKDPLFNHLSKHRMAILPTVFMGKRLEDALGVERCEQLLTEVAEGSLRELRENALYFQNLDGKFVTPNDVVDKDKSKEILLLVIEAADDRLVGYTGHTGIIERRLDELFEETKNS